MRLSLFFSKMRLCALGFLVPRFCVKRRFSALVNQQNGEIDLLEESHVKRPNKEILDNAIYAPGLLRSTLSEKDPLLLSDPWGVESMCSIGEMFSAKMHLGHKVGTLNEHMHKYLFGHRLGVCIFDLEKTIDYLKLAINIIGQVAYRKGIILFVSNDRFNMSMVERVAQECGEFSHTRRWQRATFHNSTELFGCEVRLPDLLIFTRTQDALLETHPAVIESARLLIPTVGLVDSNCDPTLISYPVPGNDDSRESVEYFMKLCSHVILKAKEQRKQDGLDEI